MASSVGAVADKDYPLLLFGAQKMPLLEEKVQVLLMEGSG
eukprot:CAMPEP_0183301976 /NCGR_PEP_ID=MMETSP0160_2-20130417/7928_1 /TAXON_ID=2839 ORGANISM="Odontella Sinensis, Strain Grunow 1884" /NCGR_SAMPLE_ID=MMETSP0160_2 /ASSEMBLY_ACC=CAM_ASM_000250 /LENGTH=39 /DNA_ID= /DNA_START= /DNA_END= /DNA_ORIENTATION=